MNDPSMHSPSESETSQEQHAFAVSKASDLGASDNGLSLGQHSLVLFISIVCSIVLHFALIYFCSDVGVTSSTVTEQKRAHITPETLPPVRIESFLQKTELLHAESMKEPDIKEAAEQVAAQLPEKAKEISVSVPQPPSIAQIAPLPTELPFDAPPELPTFALSDALVRQSVATVPEAALAPLPAADPKWVVDASITHVPNAPDLASSVEMSEILTLDAMQRLPSLPVASSGNALQELVTLATATPETVPLPEIAVTGPDTETLEKRADERATETTKALLNTLSDTPKYTPIDDRLSVAFTTYEAENDPYYTYFRLAIVRRPESPLPIMNKDVIFIQDISGSIGAKRLKRSKEAMKSALYRTLRSGDRFNIFAFRDVTLTPSGTWMDFNPQTYKKAETFVDSLRALGNTDLFLLLQDLLTLPRDAARPLIAIVVTDGEPTVGETETTRIIGEFTRMNQGNISVYTFGIKQVNPYFLDMLCYANRGENTSASGNVNAIKDELIPLYDAIRNPVMKNLSVTFSARNGGEVHPKNVTHLYADKSLMLYGRVPRDTKQVTCQLKGRSASEAYDAIFSFALSDAQRSEQNLRKAWAERAMFDLLSDYAENPSAALLKRISIFSQVYGVPNPYRTLK